MNFFYVNKSKIKFDYVITVIKIYLLTIIIITYIFFDNTSTFLKIRILIN